MDNLLDELLSFFIKNPEKEFYVRELAKITKKSPTTISKYLNKLEKEGILLSRRKFNHLLFKANDKTPAFRDIKLYHNIKKLRDSGLIDYLIDKFNNPEAIVLFGSYAKAEDSSKSDIDLLIITPMKKEVKLEKFEKFLKRKIQIFAHSNIEIKKISLKNKELINNLVNGVVLEGFWEVFR